MPKAIEFGLELYLVDLYRDCWNQVPVVKHGPTLGVSSFT